MTDNNFNIDQSIIMRLITVIILINLIYLLFLNPLSAIEDITLGKNIIEDAEEMEHSETLKKMGELYVDYGFGKLYYSLIFTLFVIVIDGILIYLLFDMYKRAKQ